MCFICGCINWFWFTRPEESPFAEAYSGVTSSTGHLQLTIRIVCFTICYFCAYLRSSQTGSLILVSSPTVYLICQFSFSITAFKRATTHSLHYQFGRFNSLQYHVRFLWHDHSQLLHSGAEVRVKRNRRLGLGRLVLADASYPAHFVHKVPLAKIQLRRLSVLFFISLSE